jgi:guanine nucleotide-binding protein subunit beta-2-like 1 protein
MLDAEDLADSNIPPLSFVHTEPVVAMAFSPNRYWLAVAYESNIKLYDLDSKEVLQELKLELEQPDGKPSKLGKCTTLEWSAEGANLFAAFNDWR